MHTAVSDVNGVEYLVQTGNLATYIPRNIKALSKDSIRRSFSLVSPLYHKQNYFMLKGGIHFVNDSISTNVNSTWFALENATGPIVWIAGGVDIRNDYSSLDKLVRKKVAGIICIGLDNTRLHAEFGKKVVTMITCTNMRDAVKMASNISKPGHTVLLSPACASFDLFNNYEDRGQQFMDMVFEM